MGWTVIGALALVAGSFALKVPGVPVYLSISDTFFITSALLFGPAPATVIIALDSLFISLRNRRNALHQTIFNATSSAISLWVAAQAFFAIAQSGPIVDVKTAAGRVDDVGARVSGDALLHAQLRVHRDRGVPAEGRVRFSPLWRQHFAIVSLNHFAAASASFFLIVLMRYVEPIAIAAVVPRCS